MKTYLTLILLLPLTSLVLSQQVEPPASPHSHKSDHICSRLSNLVTQNKANIPQKSQLFQKESSPADCQVSLADWSSHIGSDLVNELKNVTEYDCTRSLFDLGSDNLSEVVFSNANIQAVAREMSNISISHDGTINSGMYGLLIYLHTALYQEFGIETVSLNEKSKELLFAAMESFANNEHFWNVDETGLNILLEYLIICDTSGLRHRDKILTVVKDAMKNLIIEDNWKSILSSPKLISKYGNAYNKILFLLFRGVANRDSDYISAVHEDTELIELLYLISRDAELIANEDLRFLVNNAVSELTRMASSDVLRLDVETYIADLASFYPRLTPNWYKVVNTIIKYNCSGYNNLCDDPEAIRQEVEDMLFPNTYLFDDGKLKIRTPLPYDKAQALYYASKQVQSQFFRFLQTDEPVKDDPNLELNIVLYGTLKEYKDWNPLLNNLSVDNGGIYIERGATFYTYERTTKESIFSLEELFRHEYTHYLQGRYLENGYWGRTDFYRNSRLVWFDEGMAEHFAGSTDNEEIHIRKSQGNSLRSDGASEYMTVSEVLSASYAGGFKFYRYGNILWSYWFKYDMATARQLINFVKNDDIQGFDDRISQLKQDQALQTNYTNYLNDFVINSDNWWDVNTPWIQEQSLTVSRIEDIKYEFSKITGINAEISLESYSPIRRFKATFPIAITGSENFETHLDGVIAQLKDNPTINNFHYIVGYYTDVNGSSATASITGSLFTDITPPVITLSGENPQVIRMGNPYMEPGATVTDNVDEDITTNIVIDASAVDTTVPGSYMVTYNVDDVTGNSATEQIRVVNVNETTPPVITLSGENPQVIEMGNPYMEPGATATDNVDGDITANIVIDASAVDTTVPGSYMVTYNVDDVAGNSATEQIRVVNVNEASPPVITLSGENPQVIEMGNPYMESGATATDNVDGDITANIVIDASAVDTTVPGSYMVTYNVDDVAGNSATEQIRVVNVILLTAITESMEVQDIVVLTKSDKRCVTH